MTPQHVISQLLDSDTKYPKNLDLLKKIILTTYLGRFRINGLSPDNKITLGNYLFDEERVMFDYTRLSDEKRALFFKWLLEPHQKEKEQIFFTGVDVNEYRGFTAEVALSWWGRLLGWFENRHAEHWKINDLSLSINYQLTGIEICQGDQGSLIGFNQFLVPRSGTKYKDDKDPQREPLGNVKRVYITDRLVDQLIKISLKSINYESICKSPHPQSIDVTNTETRQKEMYDYRKMQKFFDLKPWYVRTWDWFIALFTSTKIIEKPIIIDNRLSLLYENETTKIYQRQISKEVFVKEKKPNINNLVFCGGGGKIFAHIGVWKALSEAKIRPVNFAGSSAGAIMSLLCYLGYSADEISMLFKNFKQEHLVFFDIDRNGLSDPHSLKTALDYAVALKVKQIVTQYKLPYPEGKITFATLEALRKQCPDCGLGKELIVTATNKKLRQTRYFSLARSPDMEVSEAVKISASFPIVYRGTVIDGDEHNDGGILSNFPTEAFSDDHSTLLESEFFNNLRVLAVQFDNGTERSAVDNADEVYRENFFLNWLYSLLTGVSDPASGWEKDRLKLRQYAAQSIIVNVDDVTSSSFTVDEETQKKIIQNGYEATKNYLKARYVRDEKNNYVNQEMMYSTFNSLGDLLAYCCYRGDSRWFEIVNNLIVQSSLPNRTSLMKQSLELRQLYFKNTETVADDKPKLDHSPLTFFGNAIPHNQLDINEENHNILLAIYPLFLKLSPELIKSNIDKKIMESARHSLTLHSPFRCLTHLMKIKGEVNIITHIFINLIKELKENPSSSVYDSFKDLHQILYSDRDLLKAEYYGKWDLSLSQSVRVLKLISKEQSSSLSRLLACLQKKCEPMQTIIGGIFHEDFSEGGMDEDRMSFSM